MWVSTPRSERGKQNNRFGARLSCWARVAEDAPRWRCPAPIHGPGAAPVEWARRSELLPPVRMTASWSIPPGSPNTRLPRQARGAMASSPPIVRQHWQASRQAGQFHQSPSPRRGWLRWVFRDREIDCDDFKTADLAAAFRKRPTATGSRHRSQSPTGYSSPGCSPAQPASASPAANSITGPAMHAPLKGHAAKK